MSEAETLTPNLTDEPDVAEVLRTDGYDIAFDTASGAEPVLPGQNAGHVSASSDEAPESSESTLPSEAIVPRRGRPGRDVVALVETLDNDDTDDGTSPKKFVGRDGALHMENPRARQAFEDYMNLGPTRSLARLAQKYLKEKPPGWETNTSEQAILRKLGDYSTNLDWQNRLRMRLAHQSAQAIANAQKNASKHRAERIRRAQKMQQIAESIFDRARLLDVDEAELPPEIARQLLKPATTMMQIGLMSERLEVGESLERLKPAKPIEEMSEEELDEYIQLLRSEV